MIFGLSSADILKMLTEGLILPFLVLALFWKMSKDHDKDKKESLAREKKLREDNEKREKQQREDNEKRENQLKKESEEREQRRILESKTREDKLILDYNVREEKLMGLLDKTSTSIEKVAGSLDKLEFRMSLIERNMKIKE